MSTQQAGEHPSDWLSSGAVRDFAAALEGLEQEMARERGLLVDAGATGGIVQRTDEAQAPVYAAVAHARRLWREEQEAARLRVVERLRADALATSAFGVRDSAFGVPDESEPTATPEGQTPHAKRRTPRKEAALDDEARRWLGLLAEALELGDYSRLAI